MANRKESALLTIPFPGVLMEVITGGTCVEGSTGVGGRIEEAELQQS